MTPLTSSQRIAMLKIQQFNGRCHIFPITRRRLRDLGYITYEKLPLGRFHFTVTEAGQRALDAAATHTP